MAQAVTIHFTEILQNRQDLGTPAEEMVSTIYFTIEAGGRSWPGLETNIKQTVGSYADAPLEVELPAAYDGPINYAALRACAETYYRSAIGQGGMIFNIGAGSSVSMGNNSIELQSDCAFEAA